MTEVTAPVAGVSAGEWTVSPPSSYIYVDAITLGDHCYVRCDGQTASAVSGGHHFRVADGEGLGVRASEVGLARIETVSIFVDAAGDVSELKLGVE